MDELMNKALDDPMMKNFPPEALEKMRAQIPKVSMYSNFDML
jgi:hypothetical protein